MALGVEVRNRTAPPSRGAPTDTSRLFIAGEITTAGPTDVATLVRSIADFESAYGVRAAGNQDAYDALDTYFREGGGSAYVAKYTGASDIDDALALFDPALGPGQLMVVGETPGATTYGKMLNHAAATNRFALLDVANDDTVNAMNTLGDAVPTLNNTYGALFGPWVEVPGPAGVIGASTRQVPASAVIAALCTRVDRLGNPNRAAAGRDFPLQYTIGFVRALLAAERLDLLTHGVNTFAEVFGVLENYGFRTTRAQAEDDPFWQANCARARMWIVAQAQSLGEQFMFKPIDGRGLLARALQQAIDAVLLGLYQVDGLYGETPGDAFYTEVGPTVNIIDDIALGELHAVTEVRLTLHAESVIIDLVSVPITGTVTQA